MKRHVKYTADKDSILGAWEIKCDKCPLNLHTDALGQNRKCCTSGIQTNVQGHVVLSTCEHMKKDSMNSEGDGLFMECLKP